MLTKREMECLLCVADLGDIVSPSRLAEVMEISRVTAMENLRRLAGKGCGEYISGRGFLMNSKGRKMVLQHTRRHRIIETFFHTMLGLPLDMACREADRIDLYMGEEALMKLDQMLGHPEQCPHGKPIPKEGKA